MINKNKRIIFISSYQVYPSYHGASDVTYNFFSNWSICEKKLIQIAEKTNKKRNIININPKLSIIGKLINLIIITFVAKKELTNYKKKIIIIEGASWIGYVYFLIKLLNILIKNVKIIYHAHNLEYEVRKLKNSKIISLISFYFEKFTYQNTLGTSVSIKDKNFIKKNYLKKTILFENFVHPVKSKKNKKLKLKKNNFVFFCGSYSYWPNKIAIKKIIRNRNIILSKFPNIKFAFTGKDFPLIKDKNIVNLKVVSKANLVWLYKNCLFFYAPMPKAPGTKMKLLESIYYKSTIICSKHAIEGIKKLKKIKYIFYKNEKKLIKYLDYIKFNKLDKNNSEFINYYNCQKRIKILENEIIQTNNL